MNVTVHTLFVSFYNEMLSKILGIDYYDYFLFILYFLIIFEGIGFGINAEYLVTLVESDLGLGRDPA